MNVNLHSFIGNCSSEVLDVLFPVSAKSSGATRSINEEAIFVYSCSGQLSSFEIKSISKEPN